MHSYKIYILYWNKTQAITLDFMLKQNASYDKSLILYWNKTEALLNFISYIETKIQGDQLNMAVCFWYFVKSDSTVHQYIHWTSHVCNKIIISSSSSSSSSSNSNSSSNSSSSSSSNIFDFKMTFFLEVTKRAIPTIKLYYTTQGVRTFTCQV